MRSGKENFSDKLRWYHGIIFVLWHFAGGFFIGKIERRISL